MKKQRNEKPVISVVMSVFNGSEYIYKTIKSVLQQNFKNIEFIIVDDASTDNTVKIIESIPDSRILLIRNKQNKGLAQNLNYAIQLSRGEYIARIDADDICLRYRFDLQLLFMKIIKNVAILGGGAIVTGKQIGRAHV